MKELIFDFVTQYAVWGILIFTAAAVFLLWRVLRQQKRLNKSLAMITGNIQAYFDVIMTEEEPEEPEAAPLVRQPREEPFFADSDRGVSRRERQRQETFSAGEERSMPMTKKPRPDGEEEDVLNAVFQEFFS